MKKFVSLFCAMLLFVSMSSFTTIKKSDYDFGQCRVAITYTNLETGESYTEYWYSNSRTSAEDCAAGAEALASGNFMLSSDFRRSPVIFDM